MSLLQSQQSDAKRYQASTEDLSYRGLRFAGWYVRNKTRVANVGIGLLLVWCVVTVGYSLIMWTLYGAIGYWQDQAMMHASVAQFQDYQLMQPQFSPQPLLYGSTESRIESNDVRAYSTEVRNPNMDWIASVQFRYGSSDTAPTFTQLVLPGARTLLADLGSENRGVSERLHIVDTRWQRINRHAVTDPLSFIAARLQSQLSDVMIVQADSTQGTPSLVSFILTNESAYGFWEGNYFVLFYSGERVVAVRPLLIDRFAAGTSHRIEFNFGTDRLTITDVEVLPNINVFDADVYLPVRTF